MKKKLIIILAILLVLGGAVIAYFTLHKTITLEVNGESQSIITYTFTVGDFLNEQSLTLKEEDELSLPLEHWLREGERVQIEQAGHFFITSDGKEHTALTAARNPADIFTEAGISLHPGDEIYLNGSLIPATEQISYQVSQSLVLRRSTPITLYIDGEKRTFRSTAETLGQALWDEGIRLRDGDQLSPPMTTSLTGDFLQARIKLAQPLNIHLAERVIPILSTSATVGEALSQSGLSLQGLDYSIPEAGSPLPEDGEIEVVRVREAIILEQEPIPFGVVFEASNEVEIDTQQVLEGGEYGIQASRVRVRYENGEEVAREVEKEWVAKEPQPRVVGYGMKIVVRSLETAHGTIQYWRTVTARATSYKPGDAGVNKWTSSGARLQKGVIAVIRSWYLYMKGARVYIPGYGFATIEDVGGGITGPHWVDLGYSESDYVPWYQMVTVYFLTPVPAPENIMWVLQ